MFALFSLCIVCSGIELEIVMSANLRNLGLICYVMKNERKDKRTKFKKNERKEKMEKLRDGRRKKK